MSAKNVPSNTEPRISSKIVLSGGSSSLSKGFEVMSVRFRRGCCIVENGGMSPEMTMACNFTLPYKHDVYLRHRMICCITNTMYAFYITG